MDQISVEGVRRPGNGVADKDVEGNVRGFNVASNSKPLFDEYNPEMLKTLTYDDKIAGVAAQQSGGVPTYCNSRYYRAVANGGQGCK